MKPMLRLAAIPLIALAALATPVAAQDTGGDKVRMVILYGDDAAPPVQGDEILVVARLPENDRYRIPEALRFSEDPANMAWARRSAAKSARRHPRACRRRTR
jgi:hypothetical protein